MSRLRLFLYQFDKSSFIEQALEKIGCTDILIERSGCNKDIATRFCSDFRKHFPHITFDGKKSVCCDAEIIVICDNERVMNSLRIYVTSEIADTFLFAEIRKISKQNFGLHMSRPDWLLESTTYDAFCLLLSSKPLCELCCHALTTQLKIDSVSLQKIRHNV